jgi:hypothetical protein
MASQLKNRTVTIAMSQERRSQLCSSVIEHAFQGDLVSNLLCHRTLP